MSKYDQYVPALMNLLSNGQVWSGRDIKRSLKIGDWVGPTLGWDTWRLMKRAIELGLVERLPSQAPDRRLSRYRKI